MTDQDAVAAELTDRVRRVDGVSDVYSPRPAVAQVPGILAAAAGFTDGAPEAEIVVDERGETPSVLARIATDAAADGVATARRVAEVLVAHTPPGTQVSVEVARIH